MGVLLLKRKRPATVVINGGFEDGALAPAWVGMASSNWAYSPITVVANRDTSFYKSGIASVKCGSGGSPGCGVAEARQGINARMVASKQLLSVRYSVLGGATGDQYIICARCYDIDGNNVSGAVALPTGWSYSDTYLALIFHDTTPTIGTWTDLTRNLLVPGGVNRIALGFAHYTGGNGYTYFDDVIL